MIHLKTDEEIRLMQHGGSILGGLLDELTSTVTAGMTTMALNDMARDYIHSYGAEGSFNKVPGYDFYICTTINEQIVHTPPSSRVLKNGDMLTIDAGVYYRGFHTDSARTIVIGGTTDPKIEAFLQAGQDALAKAIAAVHVGEYIGTISKLIEHEITRHGYGIVRQLTGHGIGHDLHEDPLVPNFLSRSVEQTPRIEPGLVIAIEPIYAMGSGRMKPEAGSDWSLVTADSSLSAQFEHTIAVTAKKVFILT